MKLIIDIYKDYVMIGTQRVNREPNFPTGQWIDDWNRIKYHYEDVIRPIGRPWLY